MLSFAQALDHLLSGAVPVSETEVVSLALAHGRVLASPLLSSLNVPPLDNSGMDGYAVRCADVTVAGASLHVTQRIPAGSVGVPLTAGAVARIFTGASIPPGADAVVMQEDCEAGAGDTVKLNLVPQPWQHIRRAGEDIAAGAVVLPAGTRLGAAEIGLAASIGIARLQVFRRVRVALLSTGDELVEPGEPLLPGSIYNSNRYFLRAQLEAFGCTVTDLGRVPDTLAATRDALRTAAAGNDLILSTGGVSVGEEDHVKPAVEAEGSLDVWQVAIKPGKPLAFGKVGHQGAAFIGMPGNPVSSYISTLLLVRPFLLKRMGATQLATRLRRVVAASAWRKPDMRRQEFLRARIDADGRAELYPNQSSGVLTSCAWADGLIDNPAGQAFAPGDEVSFIPFSELL